MDKETLDKVLELIKSDDYEMRSLGKAIFVLNEPTQEDYVYIDSTQGLLKESFPEKYIGELEIALRPKVTSSDTVSVLTGYISVVSSNSAMLTSCYYPNPPKLLKSNSLYGQKRNRSFPTGQTGVSKKVTLGSCKRYLENLFKAFRTKK